MSPPADQQHAHDPDAQPSATDASALTITLVNWSLSPLRTYHSQRVPSGPFSYVSVFWA